MSGKPGQAHHAVLVASVLYGALLRLASPAAAALVREEQTGPVARPPLTVGVALVVVTASVAGLALWWTALRATKPFVVRSARVREFRSELRDIDAVALSGEFRASEHEPSRDNGRRRLLRGNEDYT